MSDAAAKEAERLALATAQARVSQALDALASVPRGSLRGDEEADVDAARGTLASLYRSLEQRLRR